MEDNAAISTVATVCVGLVLCCAPARPPSLVVPLFVSVAKHNLAGGFAGRLVS